MFSGWRAGFPHPPPSLTGARCPARHESGKAASLSNTEGFGTLRVAPERATVQICGCVYSCVEGNSLVRYTKCTAISSQSRRFTCFPACKIKQSANIRFPPADLALCRLRGYCPRNNWRLPACCVVRHSFSLAMGVVLFYRPDSDVPLPR